MRTSVVYDRETDMLLITFYVCGEETDTLRMYPADFYEMRDQVEVAIRPEKKERAKGRITGRYKTKQQLQKPYDGFAQGDPIQKLDDFEQGGDIRSL